MLFTQLNNNAKMDEKLPQGQLLGQEQTTPPQNSKRGGKLVVLALLAIAWLSLSHATLTDCCRQISQYVGRPSLSEEQRANKILSEHPLIDGHVDFPIGIRAFYKGKLESGHFKDDFEGGNMTGHVDLPRLKAGLSGGAFWSVYAPCPEKADDFSDANLAPSVQFTLDQIDLMNRLQAKYPKDFSQQIDSAAALPAFRTGQLISPLGVEGLHQIGNKASNLRQFRSLGVRYATLTHNCHNKYADAAVLDNPTRKSEPLWGGVSPLGREMVREMNRIGMIVDISHVSEDTMVDVLGGNPKWSGSEAPVIFSHSSAWSICPHPRNVKDHVLQLVKSHNSVVMVNIAPSFIACTDAGNDNGMPDDVPANATLEQYIRHIMHIGNLIGFDHVGIGTDFDGIPTTPLGLEDVTKYPDIITELLKRGVSDEDAIKVAGGNVLRVWRAVDAVSAKMQSDGIPALEDDVPSLSEAKLDG